MTICEIVNEIERQDCVEEVSQILLGILIQRNIDKGKKLAEARACLKAIHKINKTFLKNETIDALSEV